ncbi:MAG: BamA/TamA family outer membrane protein [Magnetococcus sp. DMHC-8]
MRPGRVWVMLAWVWLAVWLLPAAGPAGAEETALSYEVRFSGLNPPDTESLGPLLRAASRCEQEKDSLPASRFVLLRRVKKDHEPLVGVLQSRGYFAAQVTSDVDLTTTPAQVTFMVEPGPVYQLGRVLVEVQQPSSVPVPPAGGEETGFALFATPTPAELALEPGRAAVSRAILTAEEHLLQEARQQGFAFARLGKRQTLVDHDQQTLDVTLRIEIGPRVRLGAVTLTGDEGIAADYLHKRIPWTPSAVPELAIRYQPRLLEEAKRAMLATGLFNTVQVRIAPEPDGQGLHPVAVDLHQRKHRSISSGIGYSTGTGAKVAANWEHRNILGGGEMLQVKGQAAMNLLHLETAFGKPDFLQMQQKLLLSASLDKEDTEAFYKDSFGIDAGLSLPWAPHVDLTYGAGYRLVNEQDRSGNQQERLFGLFSTPVKLAWDRRDNLLDPSRGWYMNLMGSGIVDTLGTGVWFGKFSGQYRFYYPLLEAPRLVMAGRIGAGTISGSGREAVPADERFFVGGGGSLRGYGFQMAGDVDQNNKPLGGRSMLEFSAEARLQTSESVGLVTFLDGGRAFVGNMPDVTESLLLGAGGGVRYKTPIGPLRLDIGVPLHRRAEVDSAYQFYVSIGQAF